MAGGQRRATSPPVLSVVHRGRRELDLIDTLVGPSVFVLILNERLVAEGQPFDTGRANVQRVRESKIAEITMYEADQYLVDDLLSRATPSRSLT